MTKQDIVFVAIGIFATLLFIRAFSAISNCTYEGMGADGWYRAKTEINRKYIDLISCSKSYQQCGYVVDECLTKVEENQ
jgi:hypothetical protein